MVGVETHVWLTQPGTEEFPSLRSAAAAEQHANVLLDNLAARHPDLAAHLERAAEWATQVTLRMGLDSDVLWSVGYAARLHDIGKLSVPRRIIDKPDRLSDAEWKVIERHTVAGAEILEAIPSLAPVAPLVRASHERWDGGGYPDKLSGEGIPIESRIIFACDAFDAMTSDRPYQDALTVAKAIRELRRCAGTQFEPTRGRRALAAHLRGESAAELGRCRRSGRLEPHRLGDEVVGAQPVLLRVDHRRQHQLLGAGALGQVE